MLAQLLVPFAQALSFWLAHQLCRDVLLYVLAVVLSGIIYCRPACLLHGTLEVHGEGVGGRGGGGGGGECVHPVAVAVAHCRHGSIRRPAV